MQLLFASYLLLASVAAKSAKQDACLHILDEASKSPQKERTYEVYTQCHLLRPKEGIVGETDGGEDCTQFTHLYQVATHYSDKFDSKEFCGTLGGVHDSDSDHLVAEHGACVTAVSEILASKEVGDAAKASCMRLKPEAGTDECSRYAEQISMAAGDAEASQVCDKILNNGSETQGFDEQHFVYSCVQYASNLIANDKKATQQHRAKSKAQVEQSCLSHTPKDQQDFCTEYADLIDHRASRPELTTFCDKQYKKMHGSASSNQKAVSSTPSHKSVAPPAQTTTTASPLGMKGRDAGEQPAANVGTGALPISGVMNNLNTQTTAAATPSTTNCEKHMAGIEKLSLPVEKKQVILQLECRNKYKGTADQCKKVGSLLLAGKNAEACRLMMPPAAPAKKGPDMMKMCSNTVDQIAILDLSGDAFEQAASDVCTEELGKTMGKTAKVTSGCRFFSKKLAGVYSSGSFEKNAFCSSLAGHTAPAQTKPKATTHLEIKKVQKTVSRTHVEKVVTKHVSTPKKKASLVVKKNKAPAQQAEGEEDFLNGFLDDYDHDQDKKKKAKAAAVQKKADELFGDDDAAAGEEPAPKKKLAKKKAKDDDDDDLGDMDSVLDGLDPASVLDPPAASPATTAATSADDSSANADATDADDGSANMDADVPVATTTTTTSTTTTTTTTTATTMQEDSSDGGDVDSLVSSFLSKNS